MKRCLEFYTETPITANLVLALEEAGISSARLWLNLQAKYDLWELKQQRSKLCDNFSFLASYV